MWFDQDSPTYGFLRMAHFSDLEAGSRRGFLVNDEIKINVEIEVVQVIDKLDESEEATQPRKKVKREESPDLPKEASVVERKMDIFGFRVLRSQVEMVLKIFERQPNMALEFRIKNHDLKTAYMNVLLSVIKTLCKSPQQITMTELTNAYCSLGTMKDAGFKLDWLEKKLNEVSKKKEKEKAYETRIQEIEQELKDLKAKVLAPFTLDDILNE